MKKLILNCLMVGGIVLLTGCGGGSSDSPMQSSTPPAAGAPVVPVTPTTPDPVPVIKPDFTTYLSQMVVSGESEEPAATDDIEFVFANNEDDSVFATLLEM